MPVLRYLKLKFEILFENTKLQKMCGKNLFKNVSPQIG